jgi:hypothetical protein
MYSSKFYQDLLMLAKQDLSLAHLRQHYTTAKSYTTAFDHDAIGIGAWSSHKPQDTLIYNNGTVTGKKFWISGVDTCDWVVIPVKNNAGLSLAVIQTQDLTITPILTQGMEGTRTVHFTCKQAPAVILGDRGDPRAWSTDHGHSWCFITNHLALATAALQDIDTYTQNYFHYDKNKIRLDIEILNQIWQDQLDYNVIPEWNRNDRIYAFAKKVVTQTAQLILEITGSGLYETDHPSHQRYQDILIYSTHMRNTATAIKDIANWSF